MAVTLDSRNGGTSSTGATSLSWSHTVIGDAVLEVTCDFAAGTRPTITGVNWDDTGSPQALTRKGGALETQGFGGVDKWYILSPTTGTKTIKVSFSGSCECGTGSESLRGVNKNDPFNSSSPQTATGTGTTQPSLNVTSEAGGWVTDGVITIEGASSNYSMTVGGGQTQISNHNRGLGTSTGAASDEAATGTSTTMSWSGVLAGDTWASVGISWRPAFTTFRITRPFALQQRMR